MTRPWYVTTGEWELRGGYIRELRLVRRGRLRALSITAMITVFALMFGSVYTATPLMGERADHQNRSFTSWHR